MKVLVTGHLGYIGVEMVPAPQGCGPRGGRSRHRLLRRMRLPSPPDPVAIDRRRPARRHRRAPARGSTRSIHLAALSNDPLGDINQQLTYDINLARVGAARARPPRRPASSGSCSRRRAACTARAATACSTRTPRSTRSRRTASRRCGSSRRSPSSADDAFSPVYLRNATAYGVSRRLRADIVVNNLVGHAVTTGKVLLQSDGTPVASAGAHRATSSTPSSACLAAPARGDAQPGVQRRRAPARTTASARSPTWWPRSSPDCEVAFAAGASADTRDYRVDFAQDRAHAAGLQAAVDVCARASRSCTPLTRSAHLSKEEWQGPRYYRLRTIQGLQKRNLLDEDLRRIPA